MKLYIFHDKQPTSHGPENLATFHNWRHGELVEEGQSGVEVCEVAYDRTAGEAPEEIHKWLLPEVEMQHVQEYLAGWRRYASEHSR